MKCPRCGYNVHVQPRSLDANALQHVWFDQASRELGEDTAAAVKRFCKLEFGCPILCAENEKFRAFYDRVIDPLPYEAQLDAMNYLNVSSVMTSGQMSRYMKDIQNHYAGRSVILESTHDPQPSA